MKDNKFVFYLLVPSFFFIIFFYLYPTLYNVINSFTDLNLFKLRKGGSWIGLKNYIDLFLDPEFIRVFFNTTIWLTLVGVTVRISLGLLLAFLINSDTLRKYKLTGLFQVSLIIPWATPSIVAVVVWRMILDPQVGFINQTLIKFGILDDPIAFLSNTSFVWPSIITIITWNTLPLVTLTFLASLKSVPAELLDAATVDGANKLQKVIYIILPHMIPSIVVMILMSTFWTFNNFAYVWLATGAGPGTFTNVMATEVYLKAFVDGRMGYSSALGIVMASIMTVFGIIYLRMIVRRNLKEIF
ncbi:MAG: sugar ABC transporter permease [SAR324 cluster bacterium]|nr:sugar ABC transporter permease [SAR324 cluster bacterium]